MHVRMQEAEQPSRQNLVSVSEQRSQRKTGKNPTNQKTHTKKAYCKKLPFWNSYCVECKVPQTLMRNEAFIAQILTLQLPWTMQRHKLLVKQIV